MPTLDVLPPESLSPALAALIESAPLPGLGADPRTLPISQSIEQLLASDSPPPAAAVAGLWLLAGELDRSHAISQSLETREGSYWHAIMHRREGDWGNSKYWLRRVGKHPVFAQLAQQVNSQRDAFQASQLPLDALRNADSVAPTLVDLCQQAEQGATAWQPDLQQISWYEWQLLFQYSL